MGSLVTAALLRIVGLGAVLAAVSEVWFYPVTLDAHVLWLCAFYGPLAYLSWLLAVQTGVRTWVGGIWAACLFGFMVEGIPVAYLYSALPFTILWTSIAWHAVVSVALGLWGFRILMSRGSVVHRSLASAVGGLYLGAWSVELWSLNEPFTQWVWAPIQDVAVQMFTGWVMFVIGHLVLDTAARFTIKPAPSDVPLMAGLAGLAFAADSLMAAFPLSLVLPVLVVLAYGIMVRDGSPDPSPFMVRLSNARVMAGGYIVSILIPVTAILTVLTLQTWDVRLESSAIHILWAGPVSLGLITWSVVRVLRTSR